MLHPRSAHGLQEGEGPCNIIGVILERVLHGFSHVSKPREMHHVRNVVLLEHLDKLGSIVQVSLHKVSLRYSFAMAIYQIVVDYWGEAALYKELHSMTPNIACPA